MTASLGEPPSHWHSVRPWSPRFLLTVREITSVSTTFVLSSACSSDGTDTSLASLGITTGSGSDDEDSVENSIPGLATSRSYMVSDALGRGLSVNVNGAAWKRVLMRMNDKGDEVILVIFGLMPGRQYDVEIGVVFGDGEEVLHSRMVTQPQPGQLINEEAGGNPVDSITSSINTVPSLPSNSSNTPVPHNRSISLDEYAAQLRLQLAHITSERDSLTAELKSARREAHKGDAAKRNEIEALKRASEKHAAVDMRGRQKLRALQEAVKQQAAAAKEAEEEARIVEKAVPVSLQRVEETEKLHAVVQKEAERTKEEAEESIRADKKRTSDLRTELGTLTARLEKLQAKKERLSKDSLPGLEAQLAQLTREVELVERDAGAFEVIDNGPVAFDLGSRGNYSESTTPFGSPSASVVRHQSLQISQTPSINGPHPKGPFSFNSNMNGTPSNGVLSNRVPPLDPGQIYNTRLGTAFQLQPSPVPMSLVNGTGGVRRIPTLPPQMSSPLAHTQSQSLDIGYSGSIHTGANTKNPNTGSIGRRPVSPGPTRQTSLPVNMPSFTNGR